MLYPQEDSWYSCLLEAESTLGAIVWLKELDKLKNSNDLIRIRTHDLVVCNVAPQPTMLLFKLKFNKLNCLQSVMTTWWMKKRLEKERHLL
jgi:hypothetical protein